MLQSVNPFTNELIETYSVDSYATAGTKIQSVHAGFLDWRDASFSDRASKLIRLAAILRREAMIASVLMATEMGKPINQGLAEVEKCAMACEFFAQNSASFLSPEKVTLDSKEATIYFQPLGVILAIMPWNFPFWQVIRFAAPGLMAGNACVLKHSSNVTGCALLLEALFKEAGLGDIFSVVLVKGESVGALIEHPLIRAVTLTGSTPAGRAVAAKAGSYLKKTVLELGGSDPYIILADADMDLAAKLCAESRLNNAGQSCVSAKRFIVETKEFEEKLIAQMKLAKLGDPLDPKTTVGPLARHDLRDELALQVQKIGATRVWVGPLPEGPGAFYPPTVLTDVPADYDEELFGPVASIIQAKNSGEAIQIANASSFGLGGGVFSSDIKKATQIALKMDAGNVAINSYVKSDPRIPFGGIKDSGYGRELSQVGIKEFVNIKTVVII